MQKQGRDLHPCCLQHSWLLFSCTAVKARFWCLSSISSWYFSWLGTAGLLKSHPEGACNLLICENARLLEEGLGSDVSFGSAAMFTVYMASQFNVWLMLGWQSSSVFSLISSGLCLGKITWGEHRDCRVFSLESLWQSHCSSAAQLAHTAVPCTRTRDRGAITTQFAHFCPGLN